MRLNVMQNLESDGNNDEINYAVIKQRFKNESVIKIDHI